ncbi:MAG: hypothetical protein D3916_15475 [Candidatus Electrothrix sp. MAN1_4]|nr:hypothetical protein [Candidatus Electrothrix sp. MAN1_4]
MELTDVIEEIRLVPKNRLRDVYNFIHFFRLGLETVQDESEDMGDLTGDEKVVESPDRHRKELETTEARLQAGLEEPMGWADAKRALLNR